MKSFACLKRLLPSVVCHAACVMILAVVPSTGKAASGTLAYFENQADAASGTHYQICTIKADGTNNIRIVHGVANETEPCLSPDGSRIAYDTYNTVDPSDVSLGIHLMNADGTNVTIVPNTSDCHSAIWSFDGTKLLAIGSIGNDDAIVTINADGSNRVARDLGANVYGGNYGGGGSWSPDGTKVVYVAEPYVDSDSKFHVYIANADGTGTPTQISTDANSDYAFPSWSPDGTKILVQKYGSAGGFYLLDSATGTETPVGSPVVAGSSPTWSPDGTQIAFESGYNDDTYGNIGIVNLDGSNFHVLTTIGQANSVKWSAAGNTSSGSAAITSPLTATATIGQPFSYQIAASGLTASSFIASGLPDKLTVDPDTGLISGTPTAAANTYPVILIASDATGKAVTATLSLVVQTGDTTPPTAGAVLAVDAADFSYSLKGQANTGIVVPGDVITYSLTVRNTGTAPASNVVVQATFDTNDTKFKGASNGGTVSGNLVTWTLPSIANGDHFVLTYKVKVKAGADTRSGVTVAANVHSITAPTLAAVDASAVPGIGLRIVPLFNVTTTNDGASARAGGPLTFTFTVTNRGAVPVDNATVDVHLPDGYVPANFKTAAFLDGSGNPVDPAYKLGTTLDNGQTDPSAVRLPIAHLAAKASQRFVVTVNVPYDATPGSMVNLPFVDLNGFVDGSKLSFTQSNYAATISTLPALSPPSLTVLKLSPTASNLQSFLSLVNDPSVDKKSYLAKSAKQFFLALSLYTGQPPDMLATMTPDQLALLLNPYVTRDTDPDTGDSLFDVPSPYSKAGSQVNPYVTYLLLYFNTGSGDAAGITITDSVPTKLALDSASITLKGLADVKTNTVGADARSLTFALGKIKSGTGGLIAYKANVPAPGDGGPNLGEIIEPTTAALTTASLSTQSFYTPAENLLVTGNANAIVDASESDPGNGTAVYTIFYKNTGGQKSKDFIVTSQVPTGGIFQSAQLLDIGQSHREPDANKGEHIYPPASPTSGQVVFELGKVKPHGQGFVQVTYQLSDAALAQKPAGLVHHYGIDQSSFPGALANAMRADRPAPRVVMHGPDPRFNLGDVGNFFKQGYDNVTHAVGSFFGGNPPVAAPTLFVQRIAPLSVQENTDFSYFVTLGNSGKQPAFHPGVSVFVPHGANFVSGTGGAHYFDTGTVVFSVDSLQPGETQTITLNFHATAAAGSTIDSDDCVFSGFGDNQFGDASGLQHVGRTSSLVYSARQAGNFAAIQTQIASNAAQAGGIDPSVLANGLFFGANAAAIKPNSMQTTIAHADYITTTQGATIVASGGGNIVASGGGNIVASGGGNIVASGGGNIVASGGGNIVASGGGNITFNNVTGLGTVNASELLSADGLAKIVASGGGNIVASGGGNIVASGGGNIVDFRTGNPLIATSALAFHFKAAAGVGNVLSLGLLSQDGGGLLSQDGGGVISRDGAGLISEDGGGFKAVGGASALISNDGGGFIKRSAHSQPVRRASSVRPGTVLGSPANSVSLDFNQTGGMIFGVGGSRANGQ